jgi:hypothetical protein
MRLGRPAVIIGIAIVAVIGFTYATYALSYEGKYDVDISFKAGLPYKDQVTITEFEYSSEPTSVMSFWNELRGKSGAPMTGTYTMYAEWNQSGEIETKVVDVVLTDVAFSESSDIVDVSFTFLNKIPGEAEVRIYVVYQYTGATIFDKTYPVVVG